MSHTYQQKFKMIIRSSQRYDSSYYFSFIWRYSWM